MDRSGIYMIEIVRPSGLPLFYIGRATRLRDRWRHHLMMLAAGRHANVAMQRAWRKYGGSAFTMSVLKFCDKSSLRSLEQAWINIAHGTPGCLNISRDTDSPWAGKTLSAVHRAKISSGGRGLRRSSETRAKIAAANTGEKNSGFGRRGRLNGRSVAVESRCLVTGVVQRFESMNLAVDQGFDQAAISRACSGKFKSHRGRTWRYATSR